ncbi:MAG: S-formylglutathione hydrolase [Dichotomicrobium sp.]
METIGEHRSHAGTQYICQHASQSTGTPMTFAAYVPDSAKQSPAPVLFYLSGLTCTHANATEKGEYRRAASELGVIVICPDTSPRGDGVADDDAYDLGQGAGFYVDATQEPWAPHFRMWRYITEELPALVGASFPAELARAGIFGHSMGGHGALVAALRKPETFRTVSAFSPIVAPSRVPWGEKAFSAYLGMDRDAWRRYDAVALIEEGARVAEILVDQGEADVFLAEQLRPELLQEACATASIPLTLRRHDGFDHSYYFISTFMADHIAWHAERLG